MQLTDLYNELLNNQLPIYTDSKQVVSLLDKRGLNNCHFTESFDFINSASKAFVIPTTYEFQQQSNQLWQQKFASILLLFSAVKFDNSVMAIDYTLEQFLGLNLADLLIKRQGFYQQIAKSSELTIKSAESSSLSVRLSDKLETANFDEILKPGWQYSFAEICEASIVNIKEDKSSFCCEGKFSFDGIIYTIGNQANRERNQDKLIRLTQAINNARQKYLLIEDNQIKSLVLDDKDQTNLLTAMDYAELERGLALTELAFGCNAQLHPNIINWQLNSVANEGVYGTHLGIGMANKCPHIDFIQAGITP